MRDTEFLLLAFEHIGLLVALMVAGAVILLLATYRRGFGLLDPLHFFYAFTFGTSYGVVAFLAVMGRLSAAALTLVIGFGSLWLIGLWIGQSALVKPMFARRTFDAREASLRSSSVLIRTLILSGVLLSVYLAIVGSPFAMVSRFQANRGIGFLPRLLDPLRIVASGLLFAAVRRRSWLWRILALAYIVLLAFASGSKFAFLECVYGAWMTTQLMQPALAKRVPLTVRARRTISALLIAVAATVFALTLLKYSTEARQAREYGSPTYVKGVSLPVELLALRIVGNGDMYYMGLPDNTFFRVVKIPNPAAQMFGMLVGNTVMEELFDYPLANSAVGRQIWLHWYPDDPVMRGPTSHFDLVAYAYFGAALGAVFCFVLGFGIGWLRRSIRRLRPLPAWKAALLAALYLRALVSLLSPAISLAHLVDLALVAWILTVRLDAPRKTVVLLQ